MARILSLLVLSSAVVASLATSSAIGVSAPPHKRSGRAAALSAISPHKKSRDSIVHTTRKNKAPTTLPSAQGSGGGPLDDLAYYGYNPKTNPQSAVIVNEKMDVKFTVLSDYVIRVQRIDTVNNPNTPFEDRATLMAVNRYRSTDDNNLVNFTSWTDAVGWFHIKTLYVELSYQLNTAFSAETLSMTMLSAAPGVDLMWHYGQHDDGNLFGTIRGLDEVCSLTLNCTLNNWVLINAEQTHCAFGMVSRKGWVVVNDTANYIMPSVNDDVAPQSGDLWFASNNRATDAEDLYLFGHGHNYRAALRDYTDMAGRTPMPRKPMFGSWFTRWFDYAQTDVEQLVDTFESYKLPLDVLVLDMNWHSKQDWTGYSWDKQLYPIPSDTIDFLTKEKKLLYSLNIHDADGIGSWEDTYQQMCSIMGTDADLELTIPFLPLNKTYFHALDDVTLQNIRSGSDNDEEAIWWIDWQQGGWCNGGCDGYQLNPTILTDHVRSTNNIRRGKDSRDAILARWGGLGGHRYPVGFTGDVLAISWECYAYQPYFSATSANVGHGTVSHDLMGPPDDHELHVRWMQFGAFSGIMRIHDRGNSAGLCWADNSCDIVDLWRLPSEYFMAIRSIMQARVSLLPYIYTVSRQTFDGRNFKTAPRARNDYDGTGISLVYSMYYDWPSHPNAYLMDIGGVYAQYMFGPKIIAAPITQQISATTGLVNKTVWLPPGTWWDDVRGRLVKAPAASTNIQNNANDGGLLYNASYTVSEFPIFYKAGAIIPRIPNPHKTGAAGEPFREIDLHIYPSDQAFATDSFTLYDDDGKSYSYLPNRGKEDDISFTYLAYNYMDAVQSAVKVTIGSASSPVSGLTRNVRIFFIGSQPIGTASVTIGGGKAVSANYTRFSGEKRRASTFSYDGVTVTSSYNVGDIPWNQEAIVTIFFTKAMPPAVNNELSFLKGFGLRTIQAKAATDEYRITPSSTVVGIGAVKQAASRGGHLSGLANPNNANNLAEFESLVGANYANMIQLAIDEFQGKTEPLPPIVLPVMVQMWNEERKDMLLCGTQACMQDNFYYDVKWVEGFQPSSSNKIAIPLYDFWNNQTGDNLADITPTPPSGYENAVFSNGFVLSAAPISSASPSVCLGMWFKSSTGDHMTTVAGGEGESWAISNGYKLLNNCIGGYLHTNKTVSIKSQKQKEQTSVPIKPASSRLDISRAMPSPHGDLDLPNFIDWCNAFVSSVRKSHPRKSAQNAKQYQRLGLANPLLYAEALLAASLPQNNPN